MQFLDFLYVELLAATIFYHFQNNILYCSGHAQTKEKQSNKTIKRAMGKITVNLSIYLLHLIPFFVRHTLL